MRGLHENSPGLLGAYARNALEHSRGLIRPESAVVGHSEPVGLIPDALEGPETCTAIWKADSVLPARQIEPVNPCPAGLGHGDYRGLRCSKLLEDLQEHSKLALASVYNDQVGNFFERGIFEMATFVVYHNYFALFSFVFLHGDFHFLETQCLVITQVFAGDLQIESFSLKLVDNFFDNFWEVFFWVRIVFDESF